MNEFHIRIHPNIETDLQSAFEFFDPLTEKMLISFETAYDKRKHFHVYIETEKTVTELRDLIKPKFNVSGNKGYSIKEPNNTNSLKSYVLKDGDFLHKGFTQRELKTCKQMSYKKVDAKFVEILQNIEKKYYENRSPHPYDIDEYLRAYLKLKSDHGQLPNKNREASHCQRLIIKKHPDLFEMYFSSVRNSILSGFVNHYDLPTELFDSRPLDYGIPNSTTP